MGLFWRRKTGDQFVTLGLNVPDRKKPADHAQPVVETPAAGSKPIESQKEVVPEPLETQPVITGGSPNPIPVEGKTPTPKNFEAPLAPGAERRAPAG